MLETVNKDKRTFVLNQKKARLLRPLLLIQLFYNMKRKAKSTKDITETHVHKNKKNRGKVDTTQEERGGTSANNDGGARRHVTLLLLLLFSLKLLLRPLLLVRFFYNMKRKAQKI